MVVEKVFSVIAESTRRDILEALAQESKAVGQLVDELGVSQPTVSKHLRVLREAGVVTMRAQGQKRFYGINTEPLALVSAWLESLGAGSKGDGAATGATATKQGATKAAPLDVSDADACAGDGATGVAKTPLAEPKIAQVPAKTAQPAVAPTPVVMPERESVSATAVPATPAAAVPGAPTAQGAEPPATSVPVGVAAASNGTRPVLAAAEAAQGASTRPVVSVARPAATQVVRVPQPSQSVAVDNDGGVPRQLGRSVGRAAKKGADLLATFKRRKD